MGGREATGQHRAGPEGQHGSPMVGRILAQRIAGMKLDVSLDPFSLDRYDGDVEMESMVIG